MTPTDAQVDHLSAAVDRAFAERDRLDDVARRTGRDGDLAAMLRQDEHAARLLDQYNAAVAAQMAEETPMPATTGGPGTPDVHDQRVGRWYDDKPITSTNTTPPGGTDMPNIEEARGSIMAGIEKENEGLGAMQSAKASLEEAQNMLLQGTQGSNQAEADQAHAQLADAMSKIDEACQQVASTLQEFEGVAQRL